MHVARRARSGYALVALAASSWGTWPLILRRVSMSSALQAALVMAVLTAVSAAFVPCDRVDARATARDWSGVAFLGVSDALNVVLFFAAYQRTSVAVAVLTHYLAPILVASCAPLVLGEALRLRTVVAVVLSFGGLLLLLEPWRTEFGAAAIAGAALGAASAVFYAANVLVNKRLSGVFSASELMFFHGLVSTPLLFLLVAREDYAAVTAPSVVLVLAAGVGPGALAGLLFTWGLRRIPSSHASVLTLLEPLVAMILAALVFGETLAPLRAAGGVLIVTGAALVVWSSEPAPS